jgi:septum formation protein
MADNRQMQAQLYLASRSPRRAELLQQLGLRFDVLPADVPEQPSPGQAPADYALAVALAKARAAAARAPLPLPVLAADTDVSIDGRILGKPRHRDDAVAMLQELSGRTHEVCSAVVVLGGGRIESVVTMTRVRFGTIDAAAAAAYWESGEPADKAGAYAVQGGAARWVRSIEGSYSGVVGLPLYETCELLARFGVQCGAGA